MAPPTVKVRYYQPIGNIIRDPIVEKLINMGVRPDKIVALLIRAEGSAQASLTEIHAPDTALQLSTAAQLKIKSASANDSASGVGIQQVILIGYTTLGLTTEILTMNGTATVTTAYYYYSVIHMYGIRFGSNNDAEGAITLRDFGDATTYLTIAAGSVDSNGCRVPIPLNWCGIVSNMRGCHITCQNALGSTNIIFQIVNEEGADPDLFYSRKMITHYNAGNGEIPMLAEISGSLTKYFKFSDDAIYSTAEDFFCEIVVILWNTSLS